MSIRIEWIIVFDGASLAGFGLCSGCHNKVLLLQGVLIAVSGLPGEGRLAVLERTPQVPRRAVNCSALGTAADYERVPSATVLELDEGMIARRSERCAHPLSTSRNRQVGPIIRSANSGRLIRTLV
jgi:hypothetical protein